MTSRARRGRTVGKRIGGVLSTALTFLSGYALCAWGFWWSVAIFAGPILLGLAMLGAFALHDGHYEEPA